MFRNPAALAPSVHDVTDQVDSLGVVMLQEGEQCRCSAANTAQVKIGEKNRFISVQSCYLLVNMSCYFLGF